MLQAPSHPPWEGAAARQGCGPTVQGGSVPGEISRAGSLLIDIRPPHHCWPVLGRPTLLPERRGCWVVKKGGEPIGSAVSTKQLAYTVRDGRLVTFHLEGNVAVQGYLAGMDGYHWLVITPSLRIHLIHKSCALVDLGKLDQESSLQNEENKDGIERLVLPFRQWLRERDIIPPGPRKGD